MERIPHLNKFTMFSKCLKYSSNEFVYEGITSEITDKKKVFKCLTSKRSDILKMALGENDKHRAII